MQQLHINIFITKFISYPTIWENYIQRKQIIIAKKIFLGERNKHKKCFN